MENQRRKIGLYAAAGVLISITIIAGMLISGIQFPGIAPQGPTGALVVLLTDAPADLDHLNVTIDSFSILDETHEIDLAFIEGRSEISFDLLSLHNITQTISDAQIPVGNYTKMRMTVKNANATFTDETWTDLTVPPGHIEIIVHFEVKDGHTTVVLIDMEADWVAISESNNLRPVLRVKSVVTS